ncbi:NAD-dependent epimerase/dehydratase family protein [Gammaproteobacteria bacterium]|nr:NAD-dependent epimerase/dehydratase family protein [Gammaproteobacteria bacterium]
MVVLVTGSSGFIGTNLCKYLKSKLGWSVWGVDINPPQVPDDLDVFLQLDLTSKSFVDEILQRCDGKVDYVFHLAAQTSGRVSEEDPILDISSNCIGVAQIVKFCELKGEMLGQFPKLIFTSSMAVYGDSLLPFTENGALNPSSTYGVSKIFGEKMLSKYRTVGGDYCIARLFNCYGPYQDMNNDKQGMLSIFMEQAIRNKKFKVTGSLERTRDFVYVDDVVTILTNSDFLKQKYTIINVCSGIEITVQELIEKIGAKYNLAGDSLIIDQLGEHAGDMNRSLGDNASLKKLIPSQSMVSLDEGLTRFMRHLNG